MPCKSMKRVISKRTSAITLRYHAGCSICSAPGAAIVASGSNRAPDSRTSALAAGLREAAAPIIRKFEISEESCDAFYASQDMLAANGFVRGSSPHMLMRDVVKLAEILAASMAEEHRQVLEKQGAYAVAAFVATAQDKQQLMERAAEAQRRLASDLRVAVEEALLTAIMSALPEPKAKGTQPDMQPEQAQPHITVAKKRRKRGAAAAAGGKEVTRQPSLTDMSLDD
jgi:hypothetical protein